jgi:hypothetical protein
LSNWWLVRKSSAPKSYFVRPPIEQLHYLKNIFQNLIGGTEENQGNP